MGSKDAMVTQVVINKGNAFVAGDQVLSDVTSPQIRITSCPFPEPELSRIPDTLSAYVKIGESPLLDRVLFVIWTDEELVKIPLPLFPEIVLPLMTAEERALIPSEPFPEIVFPSMSAVPDR